MRGYLMLPARQKSCSSDGRVPPLRERGLMQGKNRELWMLLCEQAAVEQDGEKPMKLIAETKAT